MSLSKEATEAIVKKLGKNEKDTGQTEVQIGIITQRINELTEHFKIHKKDNNSRRGLMKLVGQRRRLLDYLKKNKLDRYKTILQELGIRK